MKINKKVLWRERFWLYAPLFLWIGVIFYLSSSQGSMSQTSRFIRPFLEWLFPLAAEETLQTYHGYIRKFAHFAVYAVLAFFASRVFFYSAKNLLQRFWYLFAFLLVVLIASIDETNQSFNAARTGSIYDVLIDASGGLTMIFLFWLVRTASRKRVV
ncbi:MAG TPA: VanZ family protein [Pyrinomonadaceae bacterium]|nr:VanZ family protein [Pyrinomonadaceae bacterium]